MFLPLLCLLTLKGALAFPPDVRILIPTDDVEVGRTFSGFQQSNWNPVNWFHGSSSEDKSEMKLTVLYKTIDCLVQNSPKDCTKFLEEAQAQFEPPKKRKGTTTTTTVAPENA